LEEPVNVEDAKAARSIPHQYDWGQDDVEGLRRRGALRVAHSYAQSLEIAIEEILIVLAGTWYDEH
jgi:hypothetical protein